MSKIIVALSLLIGNSLSFSWSADIPDVVGKAYSQKNRQLVYTEEYYHITSDEHYIKYKSPEGKLFARKVVNYQSSSFAPEIEFVNDLINEEIVIAYKLADHIQVGYKNRKKSEYIIQNISLVKNLVVDAGFDNFIRENWKPMQEFQAQSIKFVIPSRLKVIELQVYKQDCPGFECFLIEPEQWLLKRLVKPILLFYDDEKRLIKFSGRSNIADENGKYQNVDIEYQYVERK